MSHDHATAESSAKTDSCCKGGSAVSGESAEGGCCGGKVKAKTGSCGQGACGCSGGNAGHAQAAPPLSAVLTVAELEALPTLHLVSRYRRGIEIIDRRVFELTEREIDQAFLPAAAGEPDTGRWPVRVLIGHVADSDLVFSHRMRRAVGEENPVLATFDEDSFVDSNLYGNQTQVYADDPEQDKARVMNVLGGHLAVVHTLRQWTGQWMLRLSEEQWERKALHPQRGAMSVKRILAYATWHLEHHGRFLARKLDKMVGPLEESSGGGCCGGKGCC